ncbi:hypothetical protein HanPI659440_Chr00c10g0722551 [Helianthus annuus]|nr:hypothetical protein HanPI659440_Chr00c10g0722551 [Helianthus annuus]
MQVQSKLEVKNIYHFGTSSLTGVSLVYTEWFNQQVQWLHQLCCWDGALCFE